MKEKLTIILTVLVFIITLFSPIITADRYNCDFTLCPTGRTRPYCTGDGYEMTYTTFYFWWGYYNYCTLDCTGVPPAGFECMVFHDYVG